MLKVSLHARFGCELDAEFEQLARFGSLPFAELQERHAVGNAGNPAE